MSAASIADRVEEALAPVCTRLAERLARLPARPGFLARGKVSQVLGTLIEAQMPPVQIGELCHLFNPERPGAPMLAEVVGFTDRAAILSALSPGELQAACAAQDAAMVARAQGVGPKLAGRIVNELKDKAGGMPGGGMATIAAPAGSASADAVSALQNLGFKPAVAAGAVAHAQAELGVDAGLNELVRVALKRAAG